jgi:DNA-binding transcriptional regulator YdaS (Cro superfamily)
MLVVLPLEIMSNIQDLFRAREVKPSRLAKELRITHGAVFQWDRVPAERVLEVERVTGIPREELRPDLYPPTASPAPEKASAQG